jgi:glycosyltransferase involved in cell wall biosynthesis
VGSKRRFSLLSVGSPSPEMLQKLGSLYTRAFSTGRIKIIVETESVRKDWEPFAGKHTVHIPVAVSTREEAVLSKSSARRMLGLPDDAFICLFFGTHRMGKDYQTAVEAAKLAKSHPFLLFAGPVISGNDPSLLIKASGYSNAASWSRFFLDSETARVFDASDLAVLPYAQGYEKGSAVLLQACEYGKPVVAANTGHLADFINLHGTGKLYTPEDPVDLAKVLDEMAYISATESIELSERIQKTADLYSWKNLTRKYIDVFDLY